MKTSPSAKLVFDRLNRVISAWESIRPNEVFAGMTLAQFREAVQPSLSARTRLEDLRNQVSALVEERADLDESSYALLRRVVDQVRGHEGDNGQMYKTIGYTTARNRESGLTRKSRDASSEPRAA